VSVAVIEFHLDARSGVAPYLQLVRQVRQALLLGLLTEGDKLPTVKEVVAKVAINPNTVSKAYRELEHLGLASARPGVGTFITRSLGQASLAEHGRLQDELRAWLANARAAGVTEPGIEAMFQTTFRENAEEEI
jgi:GntR family transcriptional regulator